MMGLTLNDLVLFGGIATVLVLLVFAFSGNSYRTQLNKRATKLKSRRTTVPKTTQDMLSLRRQGQQKQSRLIELLMHPLPNFEKLGNRLTGAGSKISAKQFLLRSIIFILLCGAAALLLKKNPVIGLCIGIVIGLWLPMKMLSFKINKQQRKFLQLFPDGIDLIVRGLRSGLPVSESINLVANEVPDPVGSTFKHVADTMRLGVPMDKALQEMAKKLGNTEFNFFTTSIILQRETGGNLSEILNNLSEVIRKRYMMRMKIKAMTSEARASSIIIGALPFVVIGAVMVFSPGYINVLVNDYRGNIAAGVAAGMLITGVWIMNRMAKFEI